MKQFYTYIALIFVIFSFLSCNKDETKIEVLPQGKIVAPTLTRATEKSTYIAEKTNLKEVFDSLSWTKADLGNPQILGSYTIQVDVTPSFTSKLQKTIGVNTYSYNLSGSELNDWGVRLNKSPNNLQKVTLYIRIAVSANVANPSSIINKPDSAYSNYVSLDVVPLLNNIPVVYVPGNQQNWNPSTASRLYSQNFDNIYTGYVYLDGEFKFTSFPNWDGDNYGAGSTIGSLALNGGNLSTNKGYYWAAVDLNKLTYKLTEVEWSVIGSALKGWDEDVMMSYNTNLDMLSVETTMKAGEFKFRRDKTWDIGLGLGINGELTSKDGANIMNQNTGLFLLTLDLSNPEEPKYSVTKK